VQHGAAFGWGHNVHDPVKGSDAVAQSGQAAAVGPRLGAADPVIADLHRAPLAVCRHLHPGGAGTGVLDDVGERLSAEEIDARLDRGGKPLAGQVELDRDGEPAGQGGESSGQAALGQDRRVDPRGEFA